MAAEDIDLNSAFDSIALTEERILAEGFTQGFESGRAGGAVEGYHMGYHRGAELGAELGYYAGVVEAWISLGPLAVPHKIQQNLRKVREQILNFPKSNVDNIDLLALADSVRASYRRVCSQLKISASYPESSKLSF